ncbi:MAG TPA: sodium:calcium antiporter [Methylotenera sp.]
MNIIELWLSFLLCFVIITFAGYALSRYGDILAEKTGISSSWIGLTLLATATSLPELATGISAVTVVNVPDIAVGDVLGSTVFNLLILVLLDALYQRETIYSRAAQGHILSAALGALLIGFTGFSLILDQAGMSPTWGHVGIYTPIIVLVYLAAMRSIHRYEKATLDKYTETSAERYPEVTLREGIGGYLIAAIFVIVAGSFLPFIASDISDMMDWDQSFVGSFFVAAATSAPEVVVTIAALKLGAIDMAIANLLGSNLFDILILAVDDLFYVKGSLLANVDYSHTITAFTAVMMSLLVIIGLIFRPQRRSVLKLTWISLSLLLLYILNGWIQFHYG